MMLMRSCAGVAVVHVLQALVYIFLANKDGYFTWGAFCALRLVMFHFTVLRRSMTSVTSGKFLLLCLVPVIGWGVWCYSKKATRSQAPHSHQHEMSNLQVRVKMRSQTASRAVLLLSSDCLLCQVYSPDSSSQTFRPPPVAAAVWNQHHRGDPPARPPPPLPRQHDMMDPSVVASAPPLQNSIEAVDSPRGRAYLATSSQQA
jgi:hypothetical protein